MSDRTLNQHSAQEAYDLLFSLQDVQRSWFLNTAEELELSPGSVLVRQNENLNAFYILMEGELLDPRHRNSLMYMQNWKTPNASKRRSSTSTSKPWRM